MVLKIPWKNLYGAAVEASVEDLYLLVVPNQQVQYDPVKEAKWAFDAKQAEIEKVELAKKKEAERGNIQFIYQNLLFLKNVSESVEIMSYSAFSDLCRNFYLSIP